MNAFETLPPFSPKGFLHVITETPKGSRNKYSYDPALGLFRLKKVLPVGAVFPFDFGFIPGTVGEDGDPLDVLILMEEPSVPGCLVEARLIGVIEASQKKDGKTVRNDRFIATARKTKGVCRPANIKDLSEDMLGQIQHFFISYNQIEGKEFKILRVSGPDLAKRMIENSPAKRA
ncbi:MAG TPA: inorganic diphosphatase [Methylomirabilota bacterium]|nr:inorganic diphosphatase [Methylomirabilota bacterium]